MRNIIKNAWRTAFAGLAVLAASALAPSWTGMAHANGGAKRPDTTQLAPTGPFAPEHQSLIRIRESDGLPLHKGITLGRNKSTLVELPRDLRDVIVSNPEIMDAVVQSSNRVYLIGKKVGQSNAFFFDSMGRQIVTLEVIVEHDTAVLEGLSGVCCRAPTSRPRCSTRPSFSQGRCAIRSTRRARPTLPRASS